VTNRLPFVQHPVFTVPQFFNKLQHLFHLAAASAAMPRPQAVCRRAAVNRASR